MTDKPTIVGALGELSLLLPTSVNQALTANDRAKYLLSLLQTARAQADDPGREMPRLRSERLACGLDEPALDGIVPTSRREPDGRYRIPHAGQVTVELATCIDAMIRPLQLAESLPALDRPAATPYTTRRESLFADATPAPSDLISGEQIAAMTRLDRERGDSLHLLVADLHRELNHLQSMIAEESIAGAKVYGIDEGDKPLIEAFMRGLAETSPLRFEHPGLGTHATRSGDVLVLQNDIGTTDAHVLVIHVRGRSVTLTYTDIHIQRAQFFQSLFEPFGVTWEDTRSQRAAGLEEGDLFYLCTGTFDGRDDGELLRYLAFLGSRIVFLIDWNRARKRLRNFLPKRECIRLLRWAADHNLGHRAFVALGAEQLVYDAIDYAARTPLRYGQRLDAVLGLERTVEYLRFVLRATSEGLRTGRTERLIRDEINTELLNYFQTAQQDLLSLATRHAALILEIASGLRDGLLLDPGDRSREFVKRTATRAQGWEKRADEIVSQVRATVDRSSGLDIYARILHVADDAADSLEEAAFHLGLMCDESEAGLFLEPLRRLADLLVAASQELVKCFANAGYVQHGAPREDLQDFLTAVDHVVTIEHETDDLQRDVTASLVRHATDHKQMHLVSEIAREMEEAADSLTHAALLLRDHAIGEVMAR